MPPSSHGILCPRFCHAPFMDCQCVCVIAVGQLGIKQSWDIPNIPGKNILKLKIHQNALPDAGFFYVFCVVVNAYKK